MKKAWPSTPRALRSCVEPNGFDVSNLLLYYESTDCSGTPLLARSVDRFTSTVFYPVDDRTTGFYAVGVGVTHNNFSEKKFGETETSCASGSVSTTFNPSDNSCCVTYNVVSPRRGVTHPVATLVTSAFDEHRLRRYTCSVSPCRSG